MRSVEDVFGSSLYVGDRRLTPGGLEWLTPIPDGPVTVVSPAFDDGSGPSVFIAGGFRALQLTGGGLRGAGGIARVRLCEDPSACYANCDGSAAPPVLNIADLHCFLERYAAGDPRANCDGSTAPPTLSAADFTCFLQRYAAGCL